MQPTGAEIEQLQHALLQAYHFDDFRTMLWLGLEVDLEQIVPLIDRNFTQIVYSTVRWAAAQEGGFLRLTNAALAANPANPELQGFAARYAHTTFDVLPLPPPGELKAPPPAPIALPFATVTIPAGPFQMGSAPGQGILACETPQFELVLGSYRIAKYPVTNAEYQEFLHATDRLAGPELEWDGQRVPAALRRRPVSGVTWYEAVAYCTWLTEKTGCLCTLPTEAQWEKAARGTDGRRYPWGEAWEMGRCNQGAGDTAAVDAFGAQSLYGCYDLVGNVRQWTASPWGERLQAPDEECRYPWQQDSAPANVELANASEIIRRVWRGGSYADPKEQLRCAFRGALIPTRAGAPQLRMGLRVVAAL